MTAHELQFDVPHTSPANNYAAHKLNKLQTDLIVAARMLVIDEVGAAVAHQLNEPLTALLIYLNELEQVGRHSAASQAASMPAWEIVGKAAREAERACEILEQTRNGVETLISSQSAVARGRDAIDAWAQANRGNAGGIGQPFSPPFGHSKPLTPREQEVLNEITAGATNKEGGHRLGISVRTFEVHRAHIMRKMGAKNAAHLVRMVLSETK